MASEDSRKRKRQDSVVPEPSLVTYHSAHKTFDRVFKEHSLQETKAVVRRKLGLPDHADIQLAQIRQGNTVALEDDDDFEAFQALSRSVSSLHIQVSVGASSVPKQRFEPWSSSVPQISRGTGFSFTTNGPQSASALGFNRNTNNPHDGQNETSSSTARRRKKKRKTAAASSLAITDVPRSIVPPFEQTSAPSNALLQGPGPMPAASTSRLPAQEEPLAEPKRKKAKRDDASVVVPSVVPSIAPEDSSAVIPAPSGEPVEPSASSLQTKKKPSSSKSRDVPKSRVHPASVPDNSDAVDNVQDIADGRTDDEATVKKKKKRSRSKSKPPGDSVSTAPPSADAPSAEEPSEVTSSKPPKKKAKKKVDQPESDAVGDRGNVLKDGVTTDALAPKSQKGSKPKTTALHQVPGKDGEPAPMSLVDDSLDAASIKEPAKKVKRKKSHKLPVVEAEPVDGGGAVADADATTPVAAPEKNAGADAATEPASKAKKPRKVVDQTVADGKKPSHKSSGKNKKPDVADDNGDAMDVDEDANPAGRQAQGSDQRPAQDKGATAGDTVPPAKPTSKKSKPDHTRGKANDARAHTDAIQSAPRAPSESPSVVPSSSPPCPLCLSGSFHLRARCPVITSDTETIRERLAKLKAENSGNHDALISELEELLRKRDATASTTAPPVSNGRGPPKISSSSTKQSRSKAPPSSLVPDSLLGDDSSDDGRFIGKNQTTRTVLPHADDDLEALIRGPALSQQSILVDVPSASVSDDGRNEASAEEAIEEEEYHHSARSQSSSKVSRIAAIPSLDRSSPSGDERSDASDHGANDEDTAQHDEILEDVSFEAIYGDSSQLPPQESSNLNVPDAAEHDEDVAQDGHATTSGLAHEPKSTALDTAGRTRKASTARRPLPEELEIVPETSDLDDEPAENVRRSHLPAHQLPPFTQAPSAQQIQAPPPPAPVHRSERPVSAAHTESNYRPGTPVSSRHSPNTAQAVIMEGPTTSAAGPKVDKPLPSDGPAVPPLQSQGLQSSQPVASEASAANASAPVPAPEEKPKPKRGRPKLSEEEKQRRLVEREAAKAIAAEKRRLDREEKARARAQAKEAKDAEKAAQKIGVVTAGVPPQGVWKPFVLVPSVPWVERFKVYSTPASASTSSRPPQSLAQWTTLDTDNPPSPKASRDDSQVDELAPSPPPLPPITGPVKYYPGIKAARRGKGWNPYTAVRHMSRGSSAARSSSRTGGSSSDEGSSSSAEKRSPSIIPETPQPLFIPSDSQVGFPYSQRNWLEDPEPEHEDDNNDSPVPPSSAVPYRRLTDIANNAIFSSQHTIPPTPPFPNFTPSTDVKEYDYPSGDEEEDEGHDSNSEVEDSSHIPQERKAGKSAEGSQLRRGLLAFVGLG